MISSIKLKSIVYQYLNTTNIKDVIDGNVYLEGMRPLDSKKQDIIVGTLSVNNSVLQNSVVLIGIYIPKLFLNGNYVPNYNVLLQATNLLTPLFKELYIQSEKVYLDIEYVTDYEVQNRDENVSVIRLITRKTQ